MLNKSPRVGSRGRSRWGCSSGDADLGGGGILLKGTRAVEGMLDSSLLHWGTQGGRGERGSKP